VKTLIGATIALTLLASTAAVAQRDGRDHQSQTSDHPTPASHGYQSWPKLPFVSLSMEITMRSWFVPPIVIPVFIVIMIGIYVIVHHA
jgi:hypothetical protein